MDAQIVLAVNRFGRPTWFNCRRNDLSTVYLFVYLFAVCGCQWRWLHSLGTNCTWIFQLMQYFYEFQNIFSVILFSYSVLTALMTDPGPLGHGKAWVGGRWEIGECLRGKKIVLIDGTTQVKWQHSSACGRGWGSIADMQPKDGASIFWQQLNLWSKCSSWPLAARQERGREKGGEIGAERERQRGKEGELPAKTNTFSSSFNSFDRLARPPADGHDQGHCHCHWRCHCCCRCRCHCCCRSRCNLPTISFSYFFPHSLCTLFSLSEIYARFVWFFMNFDQLAKPRWRRKTYVATVSIHGHAA